MIDPLQLVAIVALVLVAAVYVWRRVRRTMEADREFFATLTGQLSQMLVPKGFRLKGVRHLPHSFGHRIATFEGPQFLVDVAWDGQERDIVLRRRDPRQESVSAGERLAGAHVPQGSTSAAYDEALAAILTAASVLNGAA